QLCSVRNKAVQALPGQVGKCPGEGRRGIQRFRALEANTLLARIVTKCDVDVVEDFHVIADEANGLQNQRFCAVGGEAVDGFLDGGTYPGASASALALEGKLPGWYFRHLGGDQ